MSDINTKDYLADIKIHNFSEDMSIYEAAMETCLLAESNWTYIVESTALDEYASYEHAINKGEIKEDALREADEENKVNFKEKVKASIKKIGSYLYGLFSKFVAALGNLFTKHQFLVSPEAADREKNGLSKLGDNNKVEGFLVNGANIISTLEKSFKDAVAFVTTTLDNPNNVENFGDTLRGKFVGTGAVSNEDFKNQLWNKMGKSQEYTIDNSVLDQARNNFKDTKVYKASAKSMYDEVQTAINGTIRVIDAKNGDDAAKAAKLGHEAMGIISKANGIILSALNADYTTAAKILLKCYNAGGGKTVATTNNDETKQESTSYTTESIEFLFGVTV